MGGTRDADVPDASMVPGHGQSRAPFANSSCGTLLHRHGDLRSLVGPQAAVGFRGLRERVVLRGERHVVRSRDGEGRRGTAAAAGDKTTDRNPNEPAVKPTVAAASHLACQSFGGSLDQQVLRSAGAIAEPVPFAVGNSTT